MNEKDYTLFELCDMYIRAVISGVDYYRVQLHDAIARKIGTDEINHSLRRILHNLDEEIGLDTRKAELRPEICKFYAKRLEEKLRKLIPSRN